MKKHSASLLFLIAIPFISNLVFASENVPVKPKMQTERDPSDIRDVARYIYDNNCTVQLRTYVLAQDSSASVTITNSAEGGGGVISLDNVQYVITDAHVVTMQTNIWALFAHTLAPQEVQVVGYDDVVDVALLAFKDKKFKAPCALPLGDSDKLTYGDTVFTFGSSSSIGRFMLSRGSVMKNGDSVVSWSDKNGFGMRHVQPNLIFSYLNSNPGYSGSPIFNSQGELIGLNEGMIFNQSVPLNPVSVSIAVNHIKAILPQLKKGGIIKHGFINVRVEDSRWITPSDAYIGISPQNRNGPVILEVALLSAADRSGLMPGDIITAIDNIPTPTIRDFYTAMVYRLKPNTVTKLTILRNNEYVVIKVPIEEFPTWKNED